MSTIEIKKEIISKVESFNKKELEEFYGMLINFMNGNTDHDFWDTLTDDEKQAIDEGLEDIKNGKTATWEEVRKDIKNKYNI